MFHTLSNCFTYSLATSSSTLSYTTSQIFCELLLSSTMRSSKFSFIVIHSIHVVLWMQKQLNPCFHVDNDPMEFMGDFWEFECTFFYQAMKNAIILHQHGLSYNFVDELKVGN